MDFEANFKQVRLKAGEKYYDPAKEDKPPTATIQLVVDDPTDELMVLLTRLAREGKGIVVGMTDYQLSMND